MSFLCIQIVCALETTCGFDPYPKCLSKCGSICGFDPYPNLNLICNSKFPALILCVLCLEAAEQSVLGVRTTSPDSRCQDFQHS